MGWASLTRKRLNKISKFEFLMADLLDSMSVPYMRNRVVQIKGGGYRFVDFYLKRFKLLIEIDGPEHKQIKDKIREKRILKIAKGFRFIRFSNDDVLNRSEKCKKRLLWEIEKSEILFPRIVPSQAGGVKRLIYTKECPPITLESLKRDKIKAQ